jgi:hypothetical protein
MKVRRVEYKRKRNARRSYRKRWPLDRALKKVYAGLFRDVYNTWRKQMELWMTPLVPLQELKYSGNEVYWDVKTVSDN